MGPNAYPAEPTHLFYYNSLGQMTGKKLYTGGNWTGGPLWCHYDALGRRVYACDDGSNMGVAAFDGDNVVRLASNWRYVQGPGIDDPLVAVNQGNGGVWEKYYYLTDGRGRLLAFTDAAGSNRLGDVVYFQNGGNQDGSINRSNDYSNTRAESPTASGLSFYRNRYYDQNTGRWTQEDPLGVAGGTNLYGYAGNNPGTFTDPFGLCPREVGGDGKTTTYADCPPGTEGYRTYLHSQGTIGRSRHSGTSDSGTPLADPPRRDVDNQACFNASVQVADLAPVALLPVVGPPANLVLETASLAALESDIQHANLPPFRKGVARFVLGLQTITVVSGSFPPTAPVTSIAEVLLLATSTAVLTGNPDFIAAHLKACGFMPK